MKTRTARPWDRLVSRSVLQGMQRISLVLCAIVLTGCGNGAGSHQLSSLSTAFPTAAATTVGSTGGVNQTAKSSGCSLTTYSPNFAAETDPATGLPNQLYHWNSFPARVYFVVSDYMTAVRKTQALTGFGWWGLSLGQSQVYQEVNSASAANIVVKFEARGETNYGAITEYHFDSRHELVDATITFNMTYLTTVTDITSVASHEFGHALGIGGHSNDHNDVMSSSANVYYLTQLSTRDVNTLITAYCGLPVIPSNSGSSTGAITKNAIQSTTTLSCGFGVPGR